MATKNHYPGKDGLWAVAFGEVMQRRTGSVLWSTHGRAGVWSDGNDYTVTGRALRLLAIFDRQTKQNANRVEQRQLWCRTAEGALLHTNAPGRRHLGYLTLSHEWV